MPDRAALLRLVVLAVVIAAAGWLATHRAILQPAEIAAWLAALGFWAPVFFLAVYVVGAVVMFPAALLTMAGGAAFGPVWGALLDLLAATLGAGAAFLVARHLAADWVRARVGGRLARLIAGVEAEGWRFVATVRLVPILPYALMNYAFGLTRVRLGPYLAASAAGMVPASVAYTWLGYAGRVAAEGDAGGVRYGLLGLGVLGLAAFIPRVVRRMRAA